MPAGYRNVVLDDEERDDESYRTGEFIGPLLGGIANTLRPGIGGSINQLLNPPPPPPRPPIPGVQVQPAGPGVSTANIATPSGNAVLRLPEPVVSRDEFRSTTEGLQEAINRTTARVNSLESSTQRDIQNLSQRVGVVVSDAQQQLARFRTETSARIDRAERAQRADLGRFCRDQSSQATTNMLIGLLMTHRLQSRIDEHTHPNHGHTVTVTAVGNAPIDTSHVPVWRSGRWERQQPRQHRADAVAADDDLVRLRVSRWRGQQQHDGDDDDDDAGDGLEGTRGPSLKKEMHQYEWGMASRVCHRGRVVARQTQAYSRGARTRASARHRRSARGGRRRDG